MIVLSHSYGSLESITFKLLGIFPSADEAISAAQAYVRLPGFRDNPGLFRIGAYDVDRLYWVDGFDVESDDVMEDEIRISI